MEKLFKWLISILFPLFSVTLSSCSDDKSEDEPGHEASVSIVGTWIENEESSITFGQNSSYREDGMFGQYRTGTYVYNPATSMLFVDIKAVPGMNSAYQNSYIVQSLTKTTLVLSYTDGDIKGYYTRK